ncbi:MAG: 50S ribosomal protein L14e [Candidatus Aenigmatarchaeota archaeon]
MPVFEPGRVCLKLAGREGGAYCVVVGVKPPFVFVTGPKAITRVKRRRCNPAHLEPTEYKLDIPADADDATVAAAWQSSGLIQKLGIQLPVKRVLHQAAKK